METLGSLYHWSPKNRRDEINQRGLLIHSAPVTATHSQPYISASPNPRLAWQMSGAIADLGIVWDLWLIQVCDRDGILFLPQWGTEVREVLIQNDVPCDRLWWIGERRR